ncbi:MAG: hypothetical protein ABJE10_12890 [bacterium]
MLLPLCAAAVVSCSKPKTPAEDSARFTSATGVLRAEKYNWIVSSQGIGPVTFGMSLADAARALNDSAIARVSKRASCAYVHPKNMPAGTSLMVAAGIIVRVDIDSAGVETEGGLGVGDSEVAVLVMSSGRAKVESNKYEGPRAHSLIVSSPTDPEHLMIFETDGSRVRRYRAGTRAAVELVERCG